MIIFSAATFPPSRLTPMSNPNPYDTSPWSAPDASVTITSTLAKESTLKDILSLRDGLRSLASRIAQVGGETEKLQRENEMLGMYVQTL